MMMMMGLESWAGTAGSAIASVMFIYAMAHQFLPRQLDTYVTQYITKLMSVFYPYLEITFPEYSGEQFMRSDAYIAIESYLTGFSMEKARRLKAEMDRDKNNLILSMDEHEEVIDEFGGAKVWWYSRKTPPKNQTTISFYPAPEDHRYYRLVFHRTQRKLIHDSYLRHIMEQGKAIKIQKRQRKLYTNNPNRDNFEYKKLHWTHVPFEHPATFKTIAIEPSKKEDIIQDLLAFRDSKEYYAKIGKPWKRGYLLHGPPGTGKSTMIAAMANLMDYDVYDLELTAVKDNTALRKLLIETTSKSIIVIEDIDCSLDLSGRRKSTQEEAAAAAASEADKIKEEIKKPDKEDSKVTLSGLLNVIDGLWSACGAERLIVFTTNYADKLDPALIRRGRMDMHIELSYCRFPAFEVLARNYLGIEEHKLFKEIEDLMETKDMAPADVAETLMPKRLGGIEENQVEICLGNLIQELKACKPQGEEAKKETDTANGEKGSQQNLDCKPEDKAKVETEAAANGEMKPAEAEIKAENGEMESAKVKTVAANGKIEAMQHPNEENGSLSES